MRSLPKLLPLLALLLPGCAASPYGGVVDRSGYVDHVLEDVTAILEGMAAAHRGDRMVLRGPDFRSSRPQTGRE